MHAIAPREEAILNKQNGDRSRRPAARTNKTGPAHAGPALIVVLTVTCQVGMATSMP